MAAETCEPKMVHANVYDPTEALFKVPANTKAESQCIKCTLASCPLRDAGKCTLAGMFGDRCPYGTYHVSTGPTKRARSFHAWLSDERERLKGVPYLSSPAKKLAFIGDWVYLPYSHMAKCKEAAFVAHSHLLSNGTPFISLGDWTIETVETLVRFRPQAMLGGEIEAYQKEQVPLFIQHLRELDPGMFRQLVERMPEMDTEPDYVGRQVVLTTLNHPIQWTKGGPYPVTWQWDGEKLRTTSEHAYHSMWGGVKAESVVVEITPKHGQAIEVRSNEWVNGNTVFVD